MAHDLLSAAVVIGALRVNAKYFFSRKVVIQVIE